MQFYGLLGYPLGHSLSPLIHRIIADDLGLDTAYSLFEVEEDDIAQALQAMKVLSIAGANVTIPYKKKVMDLVDEVDPLAQTLQAINTIKNTEGYLKGYNTDYLGVKRTIDRHGWQVNGQAVFVLGTGGASQAVAHCLADEGGQLTLVSRQPSHQGPFKQIDYDQLADQSGGILVNTTPVGMSPHTDQSPVDEGIVRQFDIVFDVIYGKEKNRLLQLAKKQNKPHCDGLEMLVGQAIAAVEIWQNQTIDDDLMDEVIQTLKESW